ncbi:AAA family ATPase [Frateuria sp. GZRe12]|uniref:AAA family ATPase n=1 Tax=Frateuria sp. GZRe12 TaxID=3351533 RepID=UPI003EDB72C0
MHSSLATAQGEPLAVTASQVKNLLDRAVYGNDDAKAYFASIIFKHLYLIRAGLATGAKSHTLILGPTGAGKSHLVSALKDLADVPVVSVDATSLTEAGYQGRDVDSVFDDLMREASYDRLRAESGIVFIDEFDKIKAASGGERDIRGEGVQYSLLKILDGDIRQIRSTRSSRLQTVSQGDVYQFDTSKLLFIFAGAFSSSLDLLSLERITPSDIAALGFLRELTARIPNIVRLKSLAVNDVENVLDDGCGITGEYTSLFDAMGCKLEFTGRAKKRIAEETVELAIGYRGLRTVLDRTLLSRLVEIDRRLAIAGGHGHRVVVDCVDSDLDCFVIPG